MAECEKPSDDFKATFCGAEYHNIDGTGWPDAVVMENQGSVLDSTYESRMYYPERTCYADEVTHRDCKYSVNRGWRERTCTWVWMESYNTTTAINECEYAGWALDCGCFDGPIEELERFDRPEEKPDAWNYCPCCGARITDGESY